MNNKSTTAEGGLSEHLLAGSHHEDEQVPWFAGNTTDDEEAATPFATTPAPADASPIDPTAASAVDVGQAQPPRVRDAWAALLFLTKQGVMIYLALAWGYPALFQTNNNNSDENNNNTTPDDNVSSSSSWLNGATLTLLVCTSAVSLLTGVAMVAVMVRMATRLLQASLVGTVAAQMALGIYMAWQGSWVALAVCAALAGITALYARTVWTRIPAAAAHLRTAITAVQQNGSVVLVAVAMTTALSFWICIIWTLAVYGVYAHHDGTYHHLAGWTLTLLLLSLFWTIQVSANIVHVTVSGTVGTWWFCPEQADRFWSTAVGDSWRRSLTYSLGSICVGSLFAAVMHILHVVARQARHASQHSSSAAASMVVCVLECLVRCTERLLQYFNKWAFVYVGLYGYDYLTAGQKVITLFQERGWTNIIQDDLIFRCLQFVNLGLACWTGVLAMVMATMHPTWMADTWRYADSGEVSKTAWSVVFGVGFAVGMAVGHLLLGVVASAVNTVLVTWAEAPLELERHYPGLYAAQVAAWRQAYPREFGM